MKLKFSLATLVLSLFILSGAVQALTGSNSIQVEFDFAPVLALDLSDDELLISDLVPGGMRNSNGIDITVRTNNVTGYELTANVGDSNNVSRNLTHTTASASFSSIDINSNLASLTTDSTWGFSKDNGSHYSGLPLYTDEQNVLLLNDSNGAANETTSFLIGAKASAGQVAGTYTNTINFLAIAKPEPFLAMQDVTQEDVDALAIGDVMTLSDFRTGENYEVTAFELNGTKTLWMNSNLKVPAGKTLTPEDSNVSSDFTLSTEEWTSGAQDYFCKQIMATVNGEYYYNWYAATANPYVMADPTQFYCNTSYAAEESLGDICPRGWRLPTSSEIDALLTNENIYNTFFSVGVFGGGAISGGERTSGWWASSYGSSSNAVPDIEMWRSGAVLNNVSDPTTGDTVRCLLYNPNTDGGADSVTMQNMNSEFLDTLSIGSTMTLTDKRATNEEYEISVLSVNNKKFLWMNNNLRLPGGTTLTPQDSNVSGTFTLSNEQWTSSSNYFCKQIMTNSATDQSTGDFVDEYYYNFYAATANPTVCNNPGSNASATAANDANSLGDICPKGWRLPVYNEINNSTWRNAVASTLYLSGNVYANLVRSYGGNGIWWSSTRNGNQYGYYLEMIYGSPRLSSWGKDNGYTIRCLYDGDASLLAN